jgi:DNA-binding HxlR family transcriptional regulator
MKYNEKRDPIRLFIELFGGKWRLLILDELFNQTQRFKDLQKNVDGITPRMLTKELKVLVANNIVEKEVYKEMPPRVEYSLSDFGIKLLPLIENIKNFGNDLIAESVYAYKHIDVMDLSRLESTSHEVELKESITESHEIIEQPVFIKIDASETSTKTKKVENKKSVWRNYQKVDFNSIDIDQNFVDDFGINEELEINHNIESDEINGNFNLVIEENSHQNALLEKLVIEESTISTKKEKVSNPSNAGVQLSLF